MNWRKRSPGSSVRLSGESCDDVRISTEDFWTCPQQEIGRRIRELCGFEMNQKEFGQKLDISQSMVSRRGKRDIRTIELLVEIGETFVETTDWILKGEN